MSKVGLITTRRLLCLGGAASGQRAGGDAMEGMAQSMDEWTLGDAVCDDDEQEGRINDVLEMMETRQRCMGWKNRRVWQWENQEEGGRGQVLNGFRAGLGRHRQVGVDIATHRPTKRATNRGVCEYLAEVFTRLLASCIFLPHLNP